MRSKINSIPERRAVHVCTLMESNSPSCAGCSYPNNQRFLKAFSGGRI